MSELKTSKYDADIGIINQRYVHYEKESMTRQKRSDPNIV